MISKFFIERPIFANVIAIVTILLGVVALCRSADRAVPEDHAADGRSRRELSRRERRRRRRHGRAPIEQQVNGVENMLYMSSTCVERRQLLADGHVRDRHQSRHGPGAGAEPRGDRRAAVAGRSPPPGRHRQEAIDEHHVVVSLTSPDRPLRQPVSGELRHAPPARRAEPRAGRRRSRRSSAPPTTACGSGSTRASSRPAA